MVPHGPFLTKKHGAALSGGRHDAVHAERVDAENLWFARTDHALLGGGAYVPIDGTLLNAVWQLAETAKALHLVLASVATKQGVPCGVRTTGGGRWWPAGAVQPKAIRRVQQAAPRAQESLQTPVQKDPVGRDLGNVEEKVSQLNLSGNWERLHGARGFVEVALPSYHCAAGVAPAQVPQEADDKMHKDPVNETEQPDRRVAGEKGRELDPVERLVVPRPPGLDHWLRAHAEKGGTQSSTTIGPLQFGAVRDGCLQSASMEGAAQPAEEVLHQSVWDVWTPGSTSPTSPVHYVFRDEGKLRPPEYLAEAFTDNLSSAGQASAASWRGLVHGCDAQRQQVSYADAESCRSWLHSMDGDDVPFLGASLDKVRGI